MNVEVFMVELPSPGFGLQDLVQPGLVRNRETLVHQFAEQGIQFIFP